MKRRVNDLIADLLTWVLGKIADHLDKKRRATTYDEQERRR